MRRSRAKLGECAAPAMLWLRSYRPLRTTPNVTPRSRDTNSPLLVPTAMRPSSVKEGDTVMLQVDPLYGPLTGLNSYESALALRKTGNAASVTLGSRSILKRTAMDWFIRFTSTPLSRLRLS
jgi:hypothetical protein